MSQKKNNGFTLIELLAVIVILAIISLIAVPTITNIISKANKSAFKDTAYGVVSAGELYYAEMQLEPNGMLEDVTFNLPDTTNKLQMNGEFPTGTILITKEGKVAIAVYNNRYCVTKGIDDKDVKVTENYESCRIIMPGSITALATSTEDVAIPECLNDGTECALGTPVAIKVNASDIYNFYVIEDTEEEVTLIMDRNIGKQVAWYKDNDNDTYKETVELGPITLLNYLNEQTSTWVNVKPIEKYIYDHNLNGNTYEHGYQKLEIENGNGVLVNQDGNIKTTLSGISRARILTYEETQKLNETNNNITPEYLCENLGGSNPIAYWLLTAWRLGSRGTARILQYSGSISNGSGIAYMYGMRPVITLKK